MRVDFAVSTLRGGHAHTGDGCGALGIPEKKGRKKQGEKGSLDGSQELSPGG